MGLVKIFLHKNPLRFLENDADFELVWLRLFNIYGESLDKNISNIAFQ